MVLWLRCQAPTARGAGSIPGQGAKNQQAALCGQKVKQKKPSREQRVRPDRLCFQLPTTIWLGPLCSSSPRSARPTVCDPFTRPQPDPAFKAPSGTVFIYAITYCCGRRLTPNTSCSSPKRRHFSDRPVPVWFGHLWQASAPSPSRL